MKKEGLKEKIIELKNKGLSHNKISEELKCSKSTVSITCRDEKIRKNDFLKDFTKKTINNIISLRRNGKSYEELLNEFSITEDQLRIICKIFNLNNSNFYRKPTKEEIQKMQLSYNELKSSYKVAKECGWSRFTVLKYININPKLDDKTLKKNKSKSVIDWRKRTKIKLVEYKGGSCQNCNYNKSIGALEFHHLVPNEKDFSISSKSYSFEKLKKEVDKCILVCSNCHIEIHEEIKNNGYSEIVNNIN